MSHTQLLDQVAKQFRRVIPRRWRGDLPVVPVVRLSGIIGFSTPLRPGLTISAVARPLERAFAWRNAKAVALAINSPGGSAVQSHLIYQRVRQLAEENGRTVIGFIEDVGASGGYMIACACDEIICDASSLVGSIGVVGGAFGFPKLLDKLGIERRIYTAGERKVMLDPFQPEKPEDLARIKQIQNEIHQSFIALVKGRRGPALRGVDADLFSGEYWAGGRAVALGLCDAIGDLRSTLRRRYGDKVRMPLVVSERGWFGRTRPGVAAAPLGELMRAPGFADEVLSAIEARALWARYGL